MSFIGEPGTILDGENVTPHAFETLTSAAARVTIRGLVITRYAPPAQRGAIQGDNGRDWIIEDNEVSYNAAHGVRLGLSGFILRRNRIHHNSVLGVSAFNATGALIEDNEVFDNPNTAVAETAATAEASNIKLYNVNSVTVHGNHVHNGLRFGIWIDTASTSTITIENNRVTDQGGVGIWRELVGGDDSRQYRGAM